MEMKAGNAASLNSLTLSLLATTGVSYDKFAHLRHLGIEIDPEGARTVAGRTYHRLGAIDGFDASKMLRFKLALERALTRGLWDSSSGAVRSLGRHLKEHVPHGQPGSVATMVDIVSLDLLREKEISCAWLMFLSALLESCTLSLHPDAVIADIILNQPPYDEEPVLSLSIHLGQGIRWTGEGVILADDLPEGLTTCMAGRRLSEIITHPVLDRHDLVVREVWDNGLLDVGYVPYKMIDWGF